MVFADEIRSAASPSGDPYGIGGDANTIWHCNLVGPARVYELSTVDFSVDRFAASPGVNPYGIGGDANTIWHCDPNANKAYELSTVDFSVDREAASPGGNPYGIGGDANTIWHLNYFDPSRVYELSTVDFSAVRNAACPGWPQGVGGDANTIWYSDITNDKVYELSTTDFSVDREAASPSTEPRGVGGDANTIWLSDAASNKIYELDAAVLSLPTVTTQAVTNIGVITATGNGTITVTGGENADERGFVWDLATHGDPGNVAPGASGYANNPHEHGDFGAEAFDLPLTGLPPNDQIFVRAYAHNTAGYSYGGEVNFSTDVSGQLRIRMKGVTHKLTITVA